MSEISDRVERKFIDSINLDEWEIETDSGWQSASQIHKTIEYQKYILWTISGKYIMCADTHIVFGENYEQIFVKDCIPGITKIITKDGPDLVSAVDISDEYENMYDITVDSSDHRFWSGDILSHNTTTVAGFILWYILFQRDKTVAILANKGDTAKEILGRIQLAYMHLPNWLQQGVNIWNKKSFELENNSRVISSASSSDNIRGYSINFLYVDETAFLENWDEFFTSVYPTISSGKNTKVVLVSTPNGLNHFYHIWKNAIEGKNGYKPIKVTWEAVPGRDEKWKNETLAGMNFDLEKFGQEHCVEWLGSSGTLIAGWKLKELHPQIPLQQKDGIFQYKQPVAGHSYVAIVDVSRGKGLDYSAFSIIDVTSMPYEQVCVYRSNLVTPIDYADVLFRILKSYNNASTLVEINDMGEQVSNSLHYDYEFDNILYTESAGRLGKRITQGFGASVDKGIRTSKQVKSVGCSILKLLVEQNQLIVNDLNTINELSTFSRKGMSYEAEPGKHDDLVMGLVLFGWLSDQMYFKEYTNINTLAKLRDKTEEEIMADIMPFGFSSNIDQIEDIGIEIVNRNWMDDSWG